MKDCPSDWIDLEIQNRGPQDLVISEITLSGDGSDAFIQNADQLFEWNHCFALRGKHTHGFVLLRNISSTTKP